MVQRYNQPALPSPVVGTPGVDPSAGVAAGEVAKLANQSVAEQSQVAESEISNLTTAGNHLAYAAGSVLHGINAQRKAQQALQDDLAFASEQPKLAAQVDNGMNALMTKYAPTADNPLKPREVGKEAQSWAEQAINDTKTKWRDHPGIQKKAVDYVASAATNAQSHLTNTWSGTAISQFEDAQLKVGTAVAETEVANQNLKLPVSTLLQQTQNQITSALKPILTVRNQEGINPKIAGDLDLGAITAHQKISEAGVETMKASLDPITDAAGLQRLEQVREIVKNPAANGFMFSAGKQEKYMNDLSKIENDYTTTGVDILKGQVSINLLDNSNKLIYPMAVAEKQANGAMQTLYQGKIDTRVQDLNNLIETAKNLPEGRVKNQTLLGYKQEYNQLIGGTKLLNKETDIYDSKAFRDMRFEWSKGVSAVNTELQKIGLNIQINNQQYTETRTKNRILGAVQENSFNDRRNQIAAMEAGPAQKEAASQLATDVKAYTNWGIANELLNPKDSATLQKLYGTDVVTAGLYQDNGPIRFPGTPQYEHVTNETAEDKLANKQKAAAQQVELFKGMRNDGTKIPALIKQVDVSGLEANQKLALQEHIRHNLLSDLEAARSNPKSPLRPENEPMFIQARYNRWLQGATNGTLPEQLLEQKLKLKSQMPVLGEPTKTDTAKTTPTKGNPPAPKGVPVSLAPVKPPSISNVAFPDVTPTGKNKTKLVAPPNPDDVS